MSCSGCHQTRGIGGFHFPGVDWMAPFLTIRLSCWPRCISSATRSAAAISDPRGTVAPGFFAGFSAVRKCAAAPNSPAPNTRTAGARLLPAEPDAGQRRSFRSSCPRGSRCQVVTPPEWGCASHVKKARRRRAAD
jgi:hypothetical protein